MLLREIFKQEIDTFSESQLRKSAEMIALLKPRSQEAKQATPFWQSATPLERANDLRKWVAQLPITKLSLSDEACDRANIIV